MEGHLPHHSLSESSVGHERRDADIRPIVLTGIGLALINPQLEVMGCTIPEKPTGHLIAFIPAGSMANSL